MPHLILASTSPYRRDLVARLGLPFDCKSPGVAESPLPHEAPAALALRLAHAKAQAVAQQHPGALVIGSDQAAGLFHDGQWQWLPKPGSRVACREQLLSGSGQEIAFHTAAVLIAPGKVQEHIDLTTVRMRTLQPTEVDHYIDREPSFDCAGGFKCEGLGVSLFDSISTQDPTALVGLPLIWLCRALRAAGVAV